MYQVTNGGGGGSAVAPVTQPTTLAKPVAKATPVSPVKQAMGSGFASANIGPVPGVTAPSNSKPPLQPSSSNSNSNSNSKKDSMNQSQSKQTVKTVTPTTGSIVRPTGSGFALANIGPLAGVTTPPNAVGAYNPSTGKLNTPAKPQYAPGAVGPKLPTTPTTTSAKVPTPTTSATNTTGMMQYGSSGSNVAYLQHMLTNAGISTSADGQFGANTKQSVEAFQKAHGLTADGIVGPQTWNALMSAQGHSTPTSVPTVTGATSLTVGSKTPVANQTKPTNGDNPQQSGTTSTATTGTGTGTGTSTGTGSGSSTTPPFEDGSGTYDPSGVGTILGDGYGAIQSMSDPASQSQWQTQAQQEAAASYIQQETAWQTYINQLMQQEGLTDSGYQNQLNQGLNTLNDTSFQDYLQGRQDMADRGLAGSGIDAAQNTQLSLAEQGQIGQLQQQEAQQKAANDASTGQQVDSTKSQMDTLDPQALYDQYYQTISQSGQQAAQQQFNDYMQMMQYGAPYMAPTADQYGTLANTYMNDQNNYTLGTQKNQIDQQNANTAQYKAVADAKYQSVEAQVAEGNLALKGTMDQATIAQANTKLAQAQETIDENATRYAQQNANTANGQVVTALKTKMDNLTTQMDTALNNGDTSTYNKLYSQWLTYNSQMGNFINGSTGSGSSSGSGN